MHHASWLVPVLIVAIVMGAGALRTWIRVKHGYPPEEFGRHRHRNRGGSDLEAERKILLLSSENEQLTAKIGRLEERIAVLERIATDPAERTAREIDALR